MFRFLLFLFLIISVNTSFADQVEEYRETKRGITLIAFWSDTSEVRIFDAFLERLSKKLKRPSQLKIMIIVDYGFRSPWNAIIGYDSLRFDIKFIVGECNPQKKDSISEVIINQNALIDTNYTPTKEIAADWSGSCDRTNKEVGLKILYRWPESDSNSIFFDRIYSLAKYGSEHLEEIKRNQRRIEVNYYGRLWLLSVLTIDTSKIKKIPLESFGFDPNNIESARQNDNFIWIIFMTLLALGIYLFILKQQRQIK